MLIEISEVKLAMGSIRGQIWTDWRPEATFLPIDSIDLKAGIQGTFGCSLKYLRSNWPWSPLEVKSRQIRGQNLLFDPLTLQMSKLASKVLLGAH